MKSIYVTFLLICTLFFCFAGEEENEKAVFLDFESSGIDSDLTKGVMESLQTSIIGYEMFTIIERSQLDAIYAELKLTSSDDFSDSDALEVGKLAKAKIVFLGNVSKMGDRITINMRGIDVETGTALFAEKVTADSENDLPEAIDELAYEISVVAAEKYGFEVPEREDDDEDDDNDDDSSTGGSNSSTARDNRNLPPERRRRPPGRR